jgi:riboflavin transporter FmnP
MQNSQQEKNNYAQIQCPHCEKPLNVKKENALLRCPICNGGFITKIATRYKRIESEIAVAKAEKAGAGTRSTPNSVRKKTSIKQRFSAKRLALMAVFVALSYAVSWFEIPIFPAAPFLKLDLGNVFILLISFLLGPVEGVIVCLLKEGLRALGSSSGGVGEIANIIMTSSYILLPSLVYQFRKGIKTVAWSLAAACLIGTGAALLSNRYINFPLYVGGGAASFFTEVFWYVAAFNLIKTVSVSILTLLLYKRLSNFLKKMKI